MKGPSMKTFGFEIILFGWLAYNIFVEIHDYIAESMEEDEQTIVAPEPVNPGATNVK
tara:strand:+ start:962 stop:1132 length:171 start_codon:yes stop_codon:yes gene_type:complete